MATNILCVIDSKLRFSGTSTNFIYRLGTAVERVRKITAATVSIPFSYWIINSGNKTLTLNDGANTATMAEGSYNLTNFQLALKNALNAAGINVGFSVIYDVSTGLLTISNASTAFKINASGEDSLSQLLGFNVDTSTSMSVTGTTVMNTAGTRYIYVVSQKICTYHVKEKARAADGRFENAICIILPNVAFGGFITYFTPLEVTINDTKNGASFSTTDDIDFALYDEFGNIMDLHGLEWLLVLKMEKM